MQCVNVATDEQDDQAEVETEALDSLVVGWACDRVEVYISDVYFVSMSADDAAALLKQLASALMSARMYSRAQRVLEATGTGGARG